LFFADEFPNKAQGYGVSWLRVLEAVQALEADIFVPGHGPVPDDPRKHGQACVAFNSFWSKRETPSRGRSPVERPKIRPWLQ